MLEDEVERRVVVDWDVLHACKSAVRDCGKRDGSHHAPGGVVDELVADLAVDLGDGRRLSGGMEVGG